MRRIAAFVVIACAVGALAATASAQSITPPPQQLAFDRPEAWAQEYFTSVSLLTGLGVAAPDVPGSVRVQLEGGWIPPLNASQERVGFAGTAEENLNTAPMFLRPRVQVGLPARFSLIVGGVPPIRAFGVTPKLFDLAVEWTMVDEAAWRLAWRAHGQTGTVTGAFTCPAGVIALPPGGPGNPTGCQAPSADVATLRYGAIEFDVARRFAGLKSLTPHVAVSVNDIHSRFQVDALTFGRIDQSLLETGGVTWSIATGMVMPIGSRVEIAADAFYTPLTVQRSALTPPTIDGLFNVRVLASYRVH